MADLDYVTNSQSIEELLKKWLTNDYHTPKVKAEVIIDMLISEFVANMIDQKIKGQPAAVLLAKEFPIQGYIQTDKYCFENSKYAQSAAVDYLVMKGDTLYLVELKTDSNSFEHEQLFRMLMTQKLKSKSKQMFEHYSDVLTSTEEKEKYCAQANNILKMSKQADSDIKELSCNDLKKDNKTEISKRFNHLSSKEIEVIYLVLGNLIKTNYRKEIKYTYKYKDETVTFDRIEKKESPLEYNVNMNNESLPITVINMLDIEINNALWEKVKNIITVNNCEEEECQTE